MVLPTFLLIIAIKIEVIIARVETLERILCICYQVLFGQELVQTHIAFGSKVDTMTQVDMKQLNTKKVELVKSYIKKLFILPKTIT